MYRCLDLHDGVSQEVDPDPVPPNAVFLDDLVLVHLPVQVPPVQGGRVVNAEYVHRLDLEVCGLELWRKISLSPTSAPRPALTLLMTHPGGKDASAPGKTYLFMLTDCQPFLLLERVPFVSLTRDPS